MKTPQEKEFAEKQIKSVFGQMGKKTAKWVIFAITHPVSCVGWVKKVPKWVIFPMAINHPH